MKLPNNCVLDICPHCKGFVDIHLDKEGGAYLEDSYKRKLRKK